MFIEIKKHSGVLNEQLITFPESFLLNLQHVQKVWFGKTVIYTYCDNFFQTKNLARIHAEGVAQQEAVKHHDLKFSKAFEQETMQIQETEIEHIRLLLVDAKEKTDMHLYFAAAGVQEFKQIKQAIEEHHTVKASSKSDHS